MPRTTLFVSLLLCPFAAAVWDEYAWTRATWDTYKFTLPATFYKAAIGPAALGMLESSPTLEGMRTCSLFGAHLDPPPAPAKPTSLMCVAALFICIVVPLRQRAPPWTSAPPGACCSCPWWNFGLLKAATQPLASALYVCCCRNSVSLARSSHQLLREHTLTQLLGCVVCKALMEEAWYAVADWVLLHRALPERADVESALTDICQRAVRDDTL